jgi:tRNA uridine 5-carboxymethylaminomethyl modification enzyme
LRHDNADLRLTDLGAEIGLISADRYAKFVEKKRLVSDELDRLRMTKIRPEVHIQEILQEAGSVLLNNAVDLLSLLRRPEINYRHIERMSASTVDLSEEVKEQVEIQVKYSGYIEKQLLQVERLKKMDNKKIPQDIDYALIHGIATEAKQKLTAIKPMNIGQASRIPGVTPADISIFLVYLEHYNQVVAARHANGE